MNGANHQMNSVSTFPFYTLEGWEQVPPTQEDLDMYILLLKKMVSSKNIKILMKFFIKN